MCFPSLLVLLMPVQSGVVYGGSALLTAALNITPHLAGAVDIIAVEQPDGSRKSTPFYGAQRCCMRGRLRKPLPRRVIITCMQGAVAGFGERGRVPPTCVQSHCHWCSCL